MNTDEIILPYRKPKKQAIASLVFLCVVLSCFWNGILAKAAFDYNDTLKFSSTFCESLDEEFNLHTNLIKPPCISNAGEMETVLDRICQNYLIHIHHITDNVMLSAGDSLRYYVHTRSDDVLGTIFFVTEELIFSFEDANFNCDSIYYISAVVGPWIGSEIDLSHACTDVAIGKPIQFFCEEVADAGEDLIICQAKYLLVAESSMPGTWTALDPSIFVTPSDPLSAQAIFDGNAGSYQFVFSETDGSCDSQDTVTVTSLGFPRVVAATVDTVCTVASDSFRVTFTIQGGDISSYVVLGPGTLNGQLFTSDLIATGDAFLFIVSDMNGCSSDTVAGIYNCECRSRLGIVQEAELFICEDDSIVTTDYYNPVGQIILGSDVRNYIISTSKLNSLSTIVLSNTSGIFSHADGGPINFGQTYYILIILGNRIGVDQVDLTDPCLQVSNSIAVTWYEIIDEFDLIATNTELNCDYPTVDLFIRTNQDTSGYQIKWSAANGGVVQSADSLLQRLTVQVAGRYYVEISYPKADCASSAFIDVTADDNLPTVNILPPSLITCAVEEIQLNGNGSSTGSFISYEWSGPGVVGRFDSIATLVNQSGIYLLTVKDALNDCEVTTQVEVKENTTSPAVMAMAEGKIDCSLQPVTISGAGSDIGLVYLYEWQSLTDTGYIIGPATLRDVQVDVPGIYELTVLDRINGCENTDTAWVQYDENVLRSVDVNVKQPACDGSLDGSITIDSIQGGTAPFEFSINGGTNFQSSPIFGNLQPNNYIVVVRSSNNCEVREEVVLTEPFDFYVDLGFDQIWPQCTEVLVEVNTNLPPELMSSIVWTPVVDSINQNELMQHFNAELGEYRIQVTLENNNGCFVSDEVMIYIQFEKRIFIPNVVRRTSNNTKNRYANIYADPKSVSAISNFEIYDRWGSRVFYRNEIPVSLNLNIDFAWNGYVSGEELNSGNYFYRVVVDYIDGSREVKTGDILRID